MKILIASDVHGSLPVAKRIINRAKEENATRIILLGDVYYHGPRNPLPEGYAPLEVAEVLNETENLAVLKGNCDAEVDQMVSKFRFVDGILEVDDGEKRLLFTHGHVFSRENLPEGAFDLLCYGHFHTAFIETDGNGYTFANPGSPSLPKDGFSGYLVYENGRLTLKTLDGEEVKTVLI